MKLQLITVESVYVIPETPGSSLKNVKVILMELICAEFEGVSSGISNKTNDIGNKKNFTFFSLYFPTDLQEWQDYYS